ncbi:MAG: hypothetical protein KDL87_16705, partial [Verrucomicrobiae bacterium]|nr:hypothetical protein [Verrucomicrobiae bacterium]
LLPAAGGAALPALFGDNGSSSNPMRYAIRGETAPGAGAATFRSFLALGQNSSSAKYRATLAGSSSATNEGIWSPNVGLLLRKGEPFDPANYPGIYARRILRYWAVSPISSGDDQLIAWVVLGGTGVTSANNQALLLRQQDGQFLILLRTGDPAPGIGIDSVKVARFLSVEVGLFGHYAVTGVLRGTASTRNVALWQGSSGLGDETTNRQLRLPGLVLQKGDTYSTSRTPRDVIRGLLLYPAPDRTAAGLRGLSQSIGQFGHLAVGVIGDRRVTELVLLEP